MIVRFDLVGVDVPKNRGFGEITKVRGVRSEGRGWSEAAVHCLSEIFSSSLRFSHIPHTLITNNILLAASLLPAPPPSQVMYVRAVARTLEIINTVRNL